MGEAVKQPVKRNPVAAAGAHAGNRRQTQTDARKRTIDFYAAGGFETALRVI